MTGDVIDVVIVEDHDVLRAGLRYVLEPHGIRVVGDTGRGLEAQALVRELQPSVVVMDVSLPDIDGIDLIKNLCSRGTKVTVYSGFHDERLLARAMNAGSLGYVLKDNTADELVAGIKAAHDARTWISPALRGYVSIDETAAKFALLSRRERQILDLLSHGQSTDEVSVQLSLSPHTVRTHVKNAMKKLDASTRAHAVAIALRELSIR